MSSKTKNPFKILEYLQTYDPGMYALIETANVQHAFSTKNRPGITFLNPQDKKWRDNLYNMLTSENQDLVYEASDKLIACVIVDCLRSPNEFKNRVDDIPNALGQHIEIDASTTNSSRLTLKNGAHAEVDRKYAELYGKTKTAIYLLYGAEISTQNVPASFKYIKKTDRKKDKEEETIVITNERDLRNKIMLEIEDIYVQTAKRKQKNGLNNPNAYMESVLSLIHYIISLEDKSVYTNVFKGRILPMLSFSNIDFYLLFEPYRQSGVYIVDDWIVREWYTNKTAFDVKKVIDAIDEALNEKDAAVIYSGYSGKLHLLDDIDIVRESIDVLSIDRKIPSKVIDVYIEFATKNSINGTKNILPMQLAEIYSADIYRKLVEDEARYITHLLFESLENAQVFDVNKYKNILETIATYLYVNNETGSTSANQLLFVNPERIKYLINPIEKINEIRQFVDSSYFIYVPLTQKESAQYPHKCVIYKPNPNDERLYHPVGMNYHKLNALSKNTIVGESTEVVRRVLKQLELTYDNQPQEIKDSLSKLSTRR